MAVVVAVVVVETVVVVLHSVHSILGDWDAGAEFVLGVGRLIVLLSELNVELLKEGVGRLMVLVGPFVVETEDTVGRLIVLLELDDVPETVADSSGTLDVETVAKVVGAVEVGSGESLDIVVASTISVVLGQPMAGGEY